MNKILGGEGRNRTASQGAKRPDRTENTALFKRTLSLLARTPRVLFTDSFTDSGCSLIALSLTSMIFASCRFLRQLLPKASQITLAGNVCGRVEGQTWHNIKVWIIDLRRVVDLI